MKYGIIGVGAIGGYYGSKLAYSGQECISCCIAIINT